MRPTNARELLIISAAEAAVFGWASFPVLSSKSHSYNKDITQSCYRWFGLSFQMKIGLNKYFEASWN